METNKRNKRLKIIFFIFVVLLILSVYMLYTTFLASYNNAISSFLWDIQGYYPEITVPEQLFKDNLMFEFSWQLYFLLFFLVLCLLVMYYYISQSYKAYSKDIQHIIKEIDQNEFTPSTLEGELSLLEEKIYSYKKRNDKLMEKRELEKKELSDYVENIAHQIKTPIASIRLNEEIASFSRDITVLEKNKSPFDRLDHLFDSFMKLARIENETIHFELEVGSMNQLLEDVREQVLPLLENTELKIESEDIHFYYDSQWLSEAIYNIIKNCIEEGVSLVNIQTYCNSEMNHIVIRDNGNGINEEDLPYIFNRFYRSKKNKKKGVGIGLALTKEIVVGHHGFISAYNDDGAVFDLAFPILDIKEKVI